MATYALALDPITVFYGGWPRSEKERAHSEEYARFVEETLLRAGFSARRLEMSRENLRSFLKDPGSTVVYNALYGWFGEDGTIPGILEFYGVSYTGCGPLASALTFDKFRCGRLMSASGIRVPRSLLIETNGDILDCSSCGDKPTGLEKSGSGELELSVLGSPVVVKPNRGSFGSALTLVHCVPELAGAVVETKRFGSEVILQEFIEGHDIHVPVLCGRALEPAQSVVRRSAESVSGHSFSTAQRTYLIPAELTQDLIQTAKRIAECAYALAGCRGLCRADLRVTSGGEVAFLEVNTQHSIRPISIALRSGAAVGLSPEDMLQAVLQDRWAGSEVKAL